MLGLRKQLRAPSASWEAIRDQKVRKAELEATVELRRLEEDRKVLEGQRGEVEREIATMGHSEASLRVHHLIARRWAVLTALAAGIAIASAWWTVNWFLTLTWEKALLTGTLFVLPLIGWAVFLAFAGEYVKEWDLRKIFAGLGLVVVLCSATAVASLGGARMLGVGLQEEQREAHLAESEMETGSAAPAARRERVDAVKRMLNRLTMIATVLMSIAGEVAAGLAFHEYTKHATVVRTGRHFYDRRTGIIGALAANAAEEEAVRRRPEILHAELTAEALEGEAAALRMAEAEERRTKSLGPAMRGIVIAFIGLVVLLLVGAVAFGGPVTPEATVVILDLSDSVNGEEFSENLRAVEGMIRRLPAGGAALRVLAVDEASFGRTPLFWARSIGEAGRFGEYLDDWRSKTLRAWEKRAAGLKPIARGSDVIGAIGRAAVESEEAPDARKRLVILSDMRQVGRGLNFEKSIGDPRQILERLTREGMIPALKGIEVWALGVETRGIDEGHWRRLKAFWAEFFRAAGTDLKAYSPNRRLPER